MPLWREVFQEMRSQPLVISKMFMDTAGYKSFRFMDEHNATVSPLKTLEIADGCEMSVYRTLYYHRELNR